MLGFEHFFIIGRVLTDPRSFIGSRDKRVTKIIALSANLSVGSIIVTNIERDRAYCLFQIISVDTAHESLPLI